MNNTGETLITNAEQEAKQLSEYYQTLEKLTESIRKTVELISNIEKLTEKTDFTENIIHELDTFYKVCIIKIFNIQAKLK